MLIDYSNIKFIFVNKQSILALLKTKYANLGLSEETLSKMADMIVARLEAIEGDATAEQVQTEVDGVEPFAKLMQSEADRARKTKAKEDKDKANKGKDGDSTEKGKGEGGADSGNDDPTPEPDSGAPDWFKAYAKQSNEQIKALTDQLSAIQAKETTGTRKQKFEAILDGLPDAVKTSQLKDFGRITFKDDEDFENWMTEKNTDLEGLKVAIVAEDATKFGPSTPKSPGGGGGNKTASKEEINDVLSQFNL